MGGRSKKKREAIKVTRKQPKKIEERIKNKLVCGPLKSLYDPTKSPAANLLNMGLVSNTNGSLRSRKNVLRVPGATEPEVASAFVGFVKNIPDSDVINPAIGKVDVNVKRRPMSEVDQEYVVNLIRKHGDNYKAMERDIKLNNQQYTEAKCSTLCKKYLNLNPKDVLVKLSNDP